MLHQRIGLCLALVKWPLALLCLAFLPAIALDLLHQLLMASGMTFAYWWSFVTGAAAYLALWYVAIRHTKISFLSTLEHEITHCIFAWLSFNRVVAIKATLKSGGHIRYLGTPNWLILTSPYFFPTVTVVLLMVMALADWKQGLLVYSLLGASIAYHITSTWTETRHTQTDLQEAGLLFSVMFLPATNLLCYALILAYLRAGMGGMAQVFKELLVSPVGPARFIA
jgi:hypothetical protein